MTLREVIKMNRKPLLFNILAIGLLTIAVSFPLQIAWIYGHELFHADHLRAIWHKLPVNNLLTMAILMVTAWKIWHVQSGLVPWIAASCSVVAVNNFVVSAYASDWSQIQTTSATIIFAVAICAFVFTRAYELTMAPHLHWWRPALRHRVDAPVVLEFLGHHRFQAQLFDISTSGLFITGIHQQLVSSLAPVNEEMAIKIPYKNSFEAFRVKLVRKTDQRGHYPGGWGLCFVNLGFMQRMKLAMMVRSPQAAFIF